MNNRWRASPTRSSSARAASCAGARRGGPGPGPSPSSRRSRGRSASSTRSSRGRCSPRSSGPRTAARGLDGLVEEGAGLLEPRRGRALRAGLALGAIAERAIGGGTSWRASCVPTGTLWTTARSSSRSPCPCPTGPRGREGREALGPGLGLPGLRGRALGRDRGRFLLLRGHTPRPSAAVDYDQVEARRGRRGRGLDVDGRDQTSTSARSLGSEDRHRGRLHRLRRPYRRHRRHHEHEGLQPPLTDSSATLVDRGAQPRAPRCPTSGSSSTQSASGADALLVSPGRHAEGRPYPAT